MMIPDVIGDDPEIRPEAEYDLDRLCVWIHVTERQAVDLASGYVPNAVKGIVRELLEFREVDERRAARPVVQKPAKGQKRG